LSRQIKSLCDVNKEGAFHGDYETTWNNSKDYVWRPIGKSKVGYVFPNGQYALLGCLDNELDLSEVSVVHSETILNVETYLPPLYHLCMVTPVLQRRTARMVSRSSDVNDLLQYGDKVFLKSVMDVPLIFVYGVRIYRGGIHAMDRDVLPNPLIHNLENIECFKHSKAVVWVNNTDETDPDAVPNGKMYYVDPENLKCFKAADEPADAAFAKSCFLSKKYPVYTAPMNLNQEFRATEVCILMSKAPSSSLFPSHMLCTHILLSSITRR
jgi:hypothetical protein